MSDTILGMNNESILGALQYLHLGVVSYEIKRSAYFKSDRYDEIRVSIVAPGVDLKLIERIYPKNSREFFNFRLLNEYGVDLPRIFYIDAERGILLMEDLSDEFIQGNHFNDGGKNGDFIVENSRSLLFAAAKFHATFWDNYDAFGRVCLDFRLDSRENVLAHIDAMERDFIKYCDAERAGKIPTEWNGLLNTLEPEKLDYFRKAAELLRDEYPVLLETRFSCGKNITLVHGDLHPGNMFVSRTSKTVKLIDTEALRIGLCSEDLAMLLALHLEPGKNALPMLEYYHSCLCGSVVGYTFEMLLCDYRISVMENMFFVIRLINNGIFDFAMRDRAMTAFETFVLY